LKVKHVAIKNFRGIKSLSWAVRGDFNCIIGPGDTGKTTILSALDFTLAPRTSLAFDDADFFDQDVNQEISIQVTLSDWNESDPDMRIFFQESKLLSTSAGWVRLGRLPSRKKVVSQQSRFACASINP
jgi:putative ATP-dependent endonuclease of the OLD family